MAEESNQLVIQKDKFGGDEYFIPYKHERKVDQYVDKNGKKCLKYKYIEDYKSFILNYWEDQIAPVEPKAFDITEIIHCTAKVGIEGILKDKKFNGYNKKFGDTEIKVSWWGIKIDSEEATKAKAKIYKYVKKYIDDHKSESDEGGPSEKWMEELLSQYNSSIVFKEDSCYGNYKFTFNLNDIIEAYKKEYRCPKVEFKALGTYFYKQEVMHAVIAYSSNDKQAEGIFKKCSSLEKGGLENPVYMVRENGQWKLSWRPDSTGSTTQVMQNEELCPGYRHWEHCTIAFYVPKELGVENDLLSHLTACKMINFGGLKRVNKGEITQEEYDRMRSNEENVAKKNLNSLREEELVQESQDKLTMNNPSS